MSKESGSQLKRVFLIDTMSHIFRAFFAPMGARQEPLRNSKGQVTQAVFVFTNMLRKLLNDEKPDYIAAVFDSAAPTFRHDSYAAYKANRPDMPDDLSSQMPYIIKVCEAFGIPILKLDGFEADDIIGTLAQKVAEKGMQAVIVSNDKDLCQLVRDPLIVCMRQNSQNVKRKTPVPPIEWCDEAWVENKFGVPPSKIVDLLGLMGDAIDNIPGAPGIGEKGATKIIQQFGSAEEAMRRAGEVTHKTYRESLLNNQDIIRQSVELATVHNFVPVELDLDQFKYREPNRPLAYQLFRELEFTSLTREFADSTPLFDNLGEGSVVEIQKRYQIVNTRAELDKLIRRLWETEHWSFQVDDSNSPAKADSYAKYPPLGLAIATGAGASFYIDLENFAEGRDEAVAPLKDILSNGFLEKVTHDYKCNLAVLQKLGIEPEAVEDDTMIAAYLIDSSRSTYNVSNLAFQFLGADLAEETPEGWTENQYRTAERADYAFQLAPVLRRKIEEDDLERVYQEIELPLIPLLYRIEVAGMKVNVEALNGFSDFVSTELDGLREKIFAISGRDFNIASPKQVGEILSELNIETGKKTATGQISTSKDLLIELGEKYEIARLIIDYRELDKLKATYADALPKMIDADGRIHGNLNQTVATTGRLSSTDPNLQNIPIRTELGQQIRRAFIPEPGHKLISADYSQLELRLLAHITRDEVMLRAFQNNEDIHAQTAKLVFGAKTPAELKVARRMAKIVNFAIAYAVEAYGLSQRVGISRVEAKKVIEDYYETYKGVKKFMDETPEIAREKGYITSMLGRRRYFPSINDRNFSVRQRAEREAINMPIQGCLPYETKVLTSEGYRQIGELYLQGSENLRIWTGTRFADFTVLNRGECELAEIKLENGQILRCDTRHQVLAITDDGYCWKSFHELEINDRICASLAQEIEYGKLPDAEYAFLPANIRGIPFSIENLDENFYYWLGFYFGDGTITYKPADGRWNLTYSFGSAKNTQAVESVISKSSDYFTSIGLRTNTRRQSPLKAQTTIYSKGFIQFLHKIGIDTQARAKTKRLPQFVFGSPLAHRKTFLKGVLDADGYAGKNGATNPSIHLCQRELLEDLRLLFRTVGVECKIRGAYEYRGKTSYRLDLIGGMLSKAIGFCEISKVKTPKVNAPKFLIRNFLEIVSPRDLTTHSHKVLHSRLMHGGTTSVYTLAEMVKASGKTLNYPIFTFSKLKEKFALGEYETTYTLSVEDVMHCFDSEGVISKNTASDIVKASMLKVDEALRRENLQTQMIMQVHDELLFEAPEAEVERAIEVIRREMESAVDLDVPLLVEIGAGDNWMNAK
jgi:DNA polymerase-1